jgi:spore germination protein YaaH
MIKDKFMKGYKLFSAIALAFASFSAQSAVYTVKPGDTLLGIANKLNVPVNELIEKNENRSVGRDLNTGLYAGSKLLYTQPKKEKTSIAPKPNLQKRYDENLYKTRYTKNVYVTYEGTVITVEEPINYNEILD